jgi:IMP dehydrogenase
MIRKSDLIPLDYQDVVILPKHSTVKSRNDVNLVMAGRTHHPIFCAPMRGIASPELVIQLGYLGGVGILHRFFESEQDRFNAIERVGQYNHPFGIAIGINNWNDEMKFVEFAYALGTSFICIDSANAHNQRVIEATNKLASYKHKKNLDFQIIVGNVVTYRGALTLAENGANLIRVGIGSGGLCSTSNFTSIGCPSLTAIQDCAEIKAYYPNVGIIADGGVKSSGEAVKAFAWGADAVMCGSLFGKAIEANNGGVIYGMSSTKLQKEMFKEIKSNEGLVKQIPTEELRPLSEIYNEFTYGIRSGLSYLNIDDINNIHNETIEYIGVGRGTLKSL